MPATISISAQALARPAARTWLFLGLLLAIQTGLTLLDATPRYVLGDSASYLWSVFHDGPFDRSWTYPAWFLGPILTLHSLNLVVYFQCALGVIPAWLAFELVSGQDERRCDIIAFVTACVCLIEPLALTYQRFILTDSLGLVAAATAVFLCVGAIDRSARASVCAALAPLFMVLAASLRSSQVPSLALLCGLTLILLFLFCRDYWSGAAMVVSLALCQTVFSHYAIEHQGVAGYNAASGHFLLAAVLPIVSRDDVEPYIDPDRVSAILDDQARERRSRPDEMYKPGLATSQIQQATRDATHPSSTEDSKRESRLSSRIAIHAMLRDPIGFLRLTWSSYLDYFDVPYIRRRVMDEAGRREFQPDELSYFREQHIYDLVDTAVVQSPVRSYFDGAWRYYGLIPAISALLLLASVMVDRRLSTLVLSAFGLASAASHLALATEAVPRYLIVSAWVNIVVAGRVACVLAPRFRQPIRTGA